jgi:type VI secretion system secreted protein VgrG
MAADESVPAVSYLEFEIELGDHAIGDFAVLSFEAHEEVSRPFWLEATLVAGVDVQVDADALIGEKAMLVAHLADQTDRYFNGVIAQLKSWQEGADDEGRRWLVRIVPTLWRLSQQKRSRIFQDQSVTDIVKSVLDDGEVDQRWATAADYPSIDYCVQYDETDLDFVSRLLETAGIFYFFEHTQDSHTLILGDDPSVWEPLPGDPQLVFREPSGMSVQTEYVDTFLVRAEIRPVQVTLRDFNYLTPGVDLTAKSGGGGDPLLEIYEYPGGYDDGDAGDKLAQIRLEEARMRATTAEGSGYSRRFAPGTTFDLTEHPLSNLNASYHVISVDHHGDQQGVVIPGSTTGDEGEPERYRNEFTVLREEVPFRPERLTETPVIAGPQTAIVVGPKNEEIYCDEHGRVKVQFHWDREGNNDDKSSCWMRVSQAWAGPGWGALYLPRIGQEVVVEFLDGDPDQPIVVGSVYNGVNPPPISLPSDKTQSTLRSSSSPGGDGSNELRFEDAKGSEEVYLHAQKDLSIVVENDKTQKIGGNETLSVLRDRTRTVGGNQSLRVTGDDTSTIQGNQSLEVTGQRTTTVVGNDAETVTASQVISVSGTRNLTVTGLSTETVALAKSLIVGGIYDVVVGGAMTETVAGLKTEEVGGAKTEVVGSKTETVKGPRRLSVGGSLTETVSGARNLAVGGDSVLNIGGKLTQKIKDVYTFKAKEIVLDAEDSFTLKVGSATISLKKGGDVVIKGASFEVKSDGDIVLKGSKISQN